MSDKAHLVYLTGLSLDKKRLNKILSEINEDEDFSVLREYLFNVLKESIKEQNFEKNSKNLKEYLNQTIPLLINKLAGIKITLMGKYINMIFDILTEQINTKNIEANSNNLLKLFLDNLKNISGDEKNKLSSLNYNSNFFSIFLSNQSDSSASIPLAYLSGKSNKNNSSNFTTSWGHIVINHIMKINL